MPWQEPGRRTLEARGNKPLLTPTGALPLKLGSESSLACVLALYSGRPARREAFGGHAM